MSLPMSRRALGQRRSGADGRCCMLQSGKRDGAGRPRDASGGGEGRVPSTFRLPTGPVRAGGRVGQLAAASWAPWRGFAACGRYESHANTGMGTKATSKSYHHTFIQYMPGKSFLRLN